MGADVVKGVPPSWQLVCGAKPAASARGLRILCLFGALHAVMSFDSALLQRRGRRAAAAAV
jgi:hypothetical protein